MTNINTNLDDEELGMLIRYKEENNLQSNYAAIRNLVKEIKFNQEKKEEIKVPIKSEFEKLIDIIKD
jgi:hypothetical protein